MMPSCAQIGVPIHFHSSSTSGSASLMRLRILLKVSPRQSPSSAIRLSIGSDATFSSLGRDLLQHGVDARARRRCRRPTIDADLELVRSGDGGLVHPQLTACLISFAIVASSALLSFVTA